MKCTQCGTDGAYVGFSTVECVNPACQHFKSQLPKLWQLMTDFRDFPKIPDFEDAAEGATKLISEALKGARVVCTSESKRRVPQSILDARKRPHVDDFEITINKSPFPPFIPAFESLGARRKPDAPPDPLADVTGVELPPFYGNVQGGFTGTVEFGGGKHTYKDGKHLFYEPPELPLIFGPNAVRLTDKDFEKPFVVGQKLTSPTGEVLTITAINGTSMTIMHGVSWEER